jgi:hypothetical protein
LKKKIIAPVSLKKILTCTSPMGKILAKKIDMRYVFVICLDLRLGHNLLRRANLNDRSGGERPRVGQL